MSLPKLKKAYEKGTRGTSWGPLLPSVVPEFPNGQSAPALHSRAIQNSVLRVKHTHSSHSETAHSTLHTMLTPSCPVSLVQCQCFLLALITILMS
ncbi:unnamed protein product, partial [Staurois parvus]